MDAPSPEQGSDLGRSLETESQDGPPFGGWWISIIPDENGDWILEWWNDDLVGAYFVPR